MKSTGNKSVSQSNLLWNVDSKDCENLAREPIEINLNTDQYDVIKAENPCALHTISLDKECAFNEKAIPKGDINIPISSFLSYGQIIVFICEKHNDEYVYAVICSMKQMDTHLQISYFLIPQTVISSKMSFVMISVDYNDLCEISSGELRYISDIYYYYRTNKTLLGKHEYILVLNEAKKAGVFLQTGEVFEFSKLDIKNLKKSLENAIHNHSRDAKAEVRRLGSESFARDISKVDRKTIRNGNKNLRKNSVLYWEFDILPEYKYVKLTKVVYAPIERRIQNNPIHILARVILGVFLLLLFIWIAGFLL